MSTDAAELFARAREKRVEAMAIVRISHALSGDSRCDALDAQATNLIAAAEALEAAATRLQDTEG